MDDMPPLCGASGGCPRGCHRSQNGVSGVAQNSWNGGLKKTDPPTKGNGPTMVVLGIFSLGRIWAIEPKSRHHRFRCEVPGPHEAEKLHLVSDTNFLRLR